MAIYQVRAFARFARQHRISRQALAVAATDVRDGRIDADLCGGLCKQRVANQGSGKSGGFRTLITRRTSEHLFFVYGFPKNARANIDAEEARALKAMAREFGALTQAQLDQLVEAGKLEVVSDGNQ